MADKEKEKPEHNANKYIDLEPCTDSTETIEEQVLLERAALTIAQRRKRAMTMRRYKGKMQMARARMQKRRAPEDRLQVRSRRKAIGVLKKRLAPGRNYSEMSPAEKVAIDKRAERIPASLIDRIARKLLPKVRQAETERLRSLQAHSSQHESFDLNEEFESFLEQRAYKRPHKLFNDDLSVKFDKRFKRFSDKNKSVVEGILELEEGMRFLKTIPDGPKPIRKDTSVSALKKIPETGTRQTLNGLFKKQGWSIVLHKGPGYFYFEDMDPNGIADTKSIMVNSFNHQSFSRWYNDGLEFYKSLSEMNINPADREEGTDSLVKMLKGDTPGQSVKEELDIPSKKDTLGLQRRSMPQISSKDHNSFFKFLKSEGIEVKFKKVNPETLKASQGHFDQDKINSLIAAIESGEMNPETKAILISNDGYVVDGHHRWLAHVNLDKEIDVAEIDLSCKDMIEKMHEFPKSFTKNLKEDAAACDFISQAQMQSFEKIVDKLFAKFGIDFNFTKHFGERMSDSRNNPCITLKDLAGTIQKIYAKVKANGTTLSKFADTEAVIKDIQNNINIPIAVEYDRKGDELNVIAKTIMRKRNFSTPNPEIKI